MYTEYDELPTEIQIKIDTFDENKDSYKECKRIADDLKVVGWNCEYGLTGELYNFERFQLPTEGECEDCEKIFPNKDLHTLEAEHHDTKRCMSCHETQELVLEDDDEDDESYYTICAICKTPYHVDNVNVVGNMDVCFGCEDDINAEDEEDEEES